eukprot:TRINITY_DN38283_c0_g2_i1.p1 TRINITY_DN38283_c0_g2~~TRINITY_DN38283_c0_g2_i1.p1  ORF type:complete len:354 (+),score=99.66 TRINITY_DN38283_c0_g2_i1:182-1243(+)
MFNAGGGPGPGGPPPFHAFGPGGGNLAETMSLLFGQASAGGVDPAVLAEILAGAAGAHVSQAQAQPERPKGPPATAAATLRSLPRIKVTNYDIEVNESTECSICLDELVVGQPALRIPCGHLYHEDCVRDWLKKSNECPVCRYELPTDDPEAEKERQKRSAGSKIRMKKADLARKSAVELNRLAAMIGVDVRGCLEKGEIVERIASSSKVQITDADGLPEALSPEAAASSSASGLLIYSPAQLEAMSPEDIKALLHQLGLDFRDIEEDKAAMLERLKTSGRIVVSAAGPEAATPAADRSSADDEAIPTDAVTVARMSVKELRALAAKIGTSLDGCLEKGEMVQSIMAAMAARR